MEFVIRLWTDTQTREEQSKNEAALAVRDIHESLLDDALGRAHAEPWSRPRSTETLIADIVSSEKAEKYGRSSAMDEAMQQIMPVASTATVLRHFDNIHDPRKGNGLSLLELHDYVARCDRGRFEERMIEYAAENFDKLRAFDPTETGITKTALKNAMQEFALLELQRSEVQKQLSIPLSLEKGLGLLQQRFGRIQPNENLSITKFDLESFKRKTFNMENCGTSEDTKMVNEIERNFSHYTNLDRFDGDRKLGTMFLTRGNNDGISRADVATGLNQLSESRAQLQAINDGFRNFETAARQSAIRNLAVNW